MWNSGRFLPLTFVCALAAVGQSFSTYTRDFFWSGHTATS